MKTKRLVITDDIDVLKSIEDPDTYVEIVGPLTFDTIQQVLLTYAFGDIQDIKVMSKDSSVKELADQFKIKFVSIR